MKNKKLLPLVLLLAAFSASGCSTSDKERIVIRVLNSADYIYEAEEEGFYCETCEEYIPLDEVSGNEEEGYFDSKGHEVYYDSDMMQQFVDYLNNDKYKDEGIEFDYIYDTFDTPETCYNELMTGKSNYDVINVSDYMVQKMMTHDLIQPLFGEKSKIENHDEVEANISDYISKYLWGEDDSVFNKKYAKKEKYEDKEDPYDYSKCLADYSVPYMWGTIGIMYNYDFFDDESEVVDKKFSSWEVLYDEYASSSFSIKDSVRDVYAVSILHAYKDEIKKLENDYLNIPEPDEKTFNEKLTKIFNRCDEKAIKDVKEDMLTLKENAFGFEVDSGKTDMVAGDKIGANLAWSGDAAWAIYEAYDEHDVELAFSVPEEGSNIWFDAWCVPSVANHPQYALDFIEFMSEPEHAISNMDYVGYTSATAGDEVLEYIRDKYDVRSVDEEYNKYQEYDIRYFFEDSLEECDIDDALLHAWTSDADKDYEEYQVYARMLKAQFPEAKMLPHLCVMDDYGKDNEAVLDMWQSVRTNPLPFWAIILFSLEIAVALAFIIYYFVKRSLKKKYKKMY